MKPLENDLMRLEMDMDYNISLWKSQSRLGGMGGGKRDRGGKLVDTALPYFWFSLYQTLCVPDQVNEIPTTTVLAGMASRWLT